MRRNYYLTFSIIDHGTKVGLIMRRITEMFFVFRITKWSDGEKLLGCTYVSGRNLVSMT